MVVGHFMIIVEIDINSEVVVHLCKKKELIII